MRALFYLGSLTLLACQGAGPDPAADGSTDRLDASVAPVDGGAAFSDGGQPDAGGDGDPSDAGVDDAGGGALCPPAGPYGTEVGDTAADLVLMDCDGVSYSLHELCDRGAVWLFEFADWCPPCRTFARDGADAINDRFADEDFTGLMVISANADYSAPTAADCRDIQERYQLRMPVLYDPTGAFQTVFDVPANEVNVVLGPGARIDWVGRYQSSMVSSRIEATLTP